MRDWRKLYSSVIASERLGGISDKAFRLFALLVVAQDDEGKYPWTPTKVKALCIGTNWDSRGSDSALSELRERGVAQLRQGYVFLTNGAELNGTPANSKKWPFIYKDDIVTNSDSEPIQHPESSEAAPTLREEEIRGDKSRGEIRGEWAAPAWFEPLTQLPGYKKRDYTKTAASLEAACGDAGVSVVDVVKGFAEEYPVLRHQYAWGDPVAVLKGKPLLIAISRVKGGQNGNRPAAGTPTNRRLLGDPATWKGWNG